MTLVCILYALISFNKVDRRYMSQNKTLNIKPFSKKFNSKNIYCFFLFAMIFKLAMNRVRAFMYNLGDIKVVELVILLSTLLVCSAASVLTCFNEQYFELLKADEQVVWFFS